MQQNGSKPDKNKRVLPILLKHNLQILASEMTGINNF